jgi:hypothetical protein
MQGGKEILKCTMQHMLKLGDQPNVIPSEDNIINIDQEKYHTSGGLVKEK